MKLKRLWISKYKNIEDLHLSFSGDNLITLLVGQNGLGKSNLIEVLAIIFKDLDLISSEEEFKNLSYSEDHFEYEIEYQCQGHDIKIVCKKSQFIIEASAIGNNSKPDRVKFGDYKKNRGKYLPKYIVGYYSGENKRVRNIIKTHEELLKDNYRNFQAKSDSFESLELRRLFFTENHHSPLILLTLALYKYSTEFGEKVNDLFSEYLAIEEITGFSILFNNPPWKYDNIDGINKSLDHLIANIHQNVTNPFWNLKGSLDLLLTLFFNHQIERREPLIYDEEQKDRSKVIREYIEFNDIILEKLKEQLKEYFPHLIDFFSALEATIIVEIFSKANFNVHKKGIDKPIEFSQLSEGEQQLLTVLGIILIVGKDDCLFLLDEPDTHLNPKWQRDYVELLKEFNLNDDNSHIIVATHSPLIVQSSKDADVVLFTYEDNKVHAEVSKIPFHTWRTDHVLTSKYFGLESARPKDEKLDAFIKKRNEILNQEEISEDDKNELKKYEDEVGLLPTGENFEDLEAQQFINKIARKKKND